MAAILRMPSEEELPPGKRREFAASVFALYKRAGRPTLRGIVAAIAEIQEDLAGTASQETIRRILTGKTVPRYWETVEALMVGLCRLAAIDPDEVRARGSFVVPSLRAELRELWDQALDERPASLLKPRSALGTPPWEQNFSQ